MDSLCSCVGLLQGRYGHVFSNIPLEYHPFSINRLVLTPPYTHTHTHPSTPLLASRFTTNTPKTSRRHGTIMYATCQGYHSIFLWTCMHTCLYWYIIQYIIHYMISKLYTELLDPLNCFTQVEYDMQKILRIHFKISV